MTKDATTKGFRYEIEAAAALKRNGTDVVEFSRKIAVPGVEDLFLASKTDIDIVIREAGNTVYLQCKRSPAAFSSGVSAAEALDLTKGWVAKALKELGTRDPSRVRYIVPPGVNIPPRIARWLDEFGIAVQRIEHKN